MKFQFNLFILLNSFIFGLISSSSSSSLQAKELLTNSAHFGDAPKWLTSTRVNKVADSIGAKLEWDIHRVEVAWYNDEKSFSQAQKLGPMVLAVSLRNQNKILIGPRVNTENFNQVFGHELVHVISYQKYKDAIPQWLEEGLANYLAKVGKVDYAWLKKQPFPKDVKNLTHPFNGTVDGVFYHYAASQALAEMLAKKCDLNNLLRLSVGVGMEKYLDTFCEIKDLNATFQKWVQSK